MKGLITRYFYGIPAEAGTGVVEYGLLIAGIVLFLLLIFNGLGQKLCDIANLLQN